MPRVISGTAGSRRLKTVKGRATRPTSDRVKEAMFNILAAFTEGSEVLDLFAGTGSLGIEALSRGAEKAVFVDKSAECCNVIKNNLESTGFSDRAEVYTAGFEDAIARLYGNGRKFDLVFLDPPYYKNFIGETLNLLIKNDIIKSGGIIAAEHGSMENPPESCGRFRAIDSRRYGDTVIKIYKPADSE